MHMGFHVELREEAALVHVHDTLAAAHSLVAIPAEEELLLVPSEHCKAGQLLQQGDSMAELEAAVVAAEDSSR